MHEVIRSNNLPVSGQVTAKLAAETTHEIAMEMSAVVTYYCITIDLDLVHQTSTNQPTFIDWSIDQCNFCPEIAQNTTGYYSRCLWNSKLSKSRVLRELSTLLFQFLSCLLRSKGVTSESVDFKVSILKLKCAQWCSGFKDYVCMK